MGLQAFVRLASFATNAVAVGIAGRRAFGIASVQLELLLSTLLFLSREGMRNAILRLQTADRGGGGDDQAQGAAPAAPRRPSTQDQRVINAALIPIAAGCVLAGCLYAAGVGRSSSEPDPDGVPHHRLSLVLYIVAALVELCVEPLFALSRTRVLFKLQARCEGIAVSCRCAVVIATLLVGQVAFDGGGANPLRLVAFAVGQLAYAAAILMAFAWFMSRELCYPVRMCYVPRAVPRDRAQPRDGDAIGGLAATFVGQSLLKHLLTQGDSIVLTRFAAADEMGVFALVSNYGSIPARIVFLPLEEASRAVFSRMAAAGSAQGDAQNAARIMETLGRLQLLLGALVVVFGPLYAPVLLSFIRQNDSAVCRALAAYCLYLPLMGLNGFLEAFVHSVASKRQLVRANAWMAAFTAAYMAAAALALGWLGLGSAGIIAANMLNMALRVAYCASFISSWYAQRQVAGPRVAAMLPHPAAVGACLAAGAITVVSAWFSGPVPHSAQGRLAMLALGAALGAAVLAAIWRCEQPFIQSVRALRSSPPHHAKAE
ncbi:Oligosaccharide translocation protein rft1 [Coemansia helicoidea]|uniref:Oligosaccharide translocation protein rft1 n=1 Tax=Coemansia helicoidea TaxID=1286919 RepID=A0ACC1L747_9FUNG|nr:Oligosaccharide translocation protein rft1 [Coemansia helicoidea]